MMSHTMNNRLVIPKKEGEGACGKARKLDAALGGVHSTFSWNFYLHRKPVRSI